MITALAGGPDCAEQSRLYQITFTSVTGQAQVDGYECAAWVTITDHGADSEWTDGNCALLYAVRRVLPATAVATQRLSVPSCAS